MKKIWLADPMYHIKTLFIMFAVLSALINSKSSYWTICGDSFLTCGVHSLQAV